MKHSNHIGVVYDRIRAIRQATEGAAGIGQTVALWINQTLNTIENFVSKGMPDKLREATDKVWDDISVSALETLHWIEYDVINLVKELVNDIHHGRAYMVRHSPTVKIIAHTQMINPDHLEGIVFPETYDHKGQADADAIIAAAGRLCYQSWSKPNPETAKNSDYVNNTIHKQGHWSVAEHVHVSMYIDGISRSCSHEIVRHRHFNYSQLSQRFHRGELSQVIHPSVTDIRSLVLHRNAFLVDAQNFDRALERAEATIEGRKKQNESARMLLPNGTETCMVMTGNLRSWHEMLSRRIQSDADLEIRVLAIKMVQELYENISKSAFQDLIDEIEIMKKEGLYVR